MTKPRNGSTRSWRTIRAKILAGNPPCAIRAPGCTGHATHVDHIVPVSRGGTDHPNNLRPSCQHCNLSRGDGTQRHTQPAASKARDFFA